MNTSVLIIGSGGREHALAWRLAQSPRIGKLYVAPGNGGTRHVAENAPIDATDIAGLVIFAKEHEIGLTVVGPDASLALGVVDAFQAQGLRIFGPTKSAAEIEWSKSFAKRLMKEEKIPTADFEIFTDFDEALAYLQTRTFPVVLKASGLAFGKGVVIAENLDEAERTLRKIMKEKIYGAAGDEVIVEEYLQGREISIHAFCDGETAVLFPASQDHKRILEGDEGANTGGMGTLALVPWVTEEILAEIREKIVLPTLAALKKRGRVFRGILFPGVMMTTGGPKVIEFNARFGDPEAQSYMRLLKTDLLDILEACADGTLGGLAIEWRPGFAACIVIASGGYPGKYKKGIPIYGVAEAERLPGVVVFHAGTGFDGALKTSGGRVLGVTAVGDTLRDTLDCAYEATRSIRFDGMRYRRDIGAKALSVTP